jgi:uncharacterized membrane protein HdeD (DUF308 family)
MKVDIALRNWWSNLLRGFVAIVFGILLLGWPKATLKVLIILVGILFVVQGVASIIRSGVLASRRERWGWSLTGGIAGIVVGAVILAHMEFSLALVAMLAGIWIVLSGIVEVSLAFELPPQSGREIIGVIGVVSVALGIVVAAYPFETVYALSIVLGIWALVVGAMDIAAGINIRRLQAKMRAAGKAKPGEAL